MGNRHKRGGKNLGTEQRPLLEVDHELFLDGPLVLNILASLKQFTVVEDSVSNEASVFYSRAFLFYKHRIKKNSKAKTLRASLNEPLDKLNMTSVVMTNTGFARGRQETRRSERQQGLKSLRPCWPCDDFGF